jgi:hypothetical protein
MSRKYLLLFCCLVATPVFASQQRHDLDASVYDADFIFEGVIERVLFANSQPGEQPTLPHTFVTYRIERIFKGNATSTQVTLRLLGGKPDADELLHVDGFPMMDVGDRDILFVRRNGASICPLTACAAGRYRVFENAIYNEEGRAIRMTSTGGVVPGATRDFLEVRQWAAAGVELHRGGGSTQDDDYPTAPRAVRTWAAVSADAFRGMVQQKVFNMFTREQLAALPPVVSLNPSAPFDGPRLRVSPLPTGEPQ